MKYVTLEVVSKPNSFKDSKFGEAEYAKAKKLGDVRVPYSVAEEALKNSRGMYKIKAEVEAVEVKLQGLKDPDDMENAELAQEMSMWGKPPRKKMDRQSAVDFVRKLREEGAKLIGDD